MKTLNTNTLASIQLQQVIEHFNQSATSDLIEVYNEYASNNGYERVYDNDALILDDMFTSHYDALRAAFYGDYSLSHAYFTFDGYGNLQSFEYLDDDNSPIDIEELAQWIVDNELYNDYDMEVTTLNDMLASVEGSINDIDSVDNIINLLEYLDIDYLSLTEWLTNERNSIDSYIQNYIGFIIEVINNDTDYDTLENLCDYFNIEV